jgi:integrase
MSTTTLQAYVEQFLSERRRLGFGTRNMEWALASFVRWVDAQGSARPLTVEAMAAWARHPTRPSNNPATWARRLKRLRPFLRWLRQFEPRTEVPDDAIFGSVGLRLAPHIYTPEEIADLLAAARRLRPPLRGATYETLFGLLAAAGLRVAEALQLRTADVDLTAGLLTVRQTKFAKSRHVPLHPSTVAALQRYATQRQRQVANSADTPFFVATRGRRLGQALGLRQVDRVFSALRDQLGWVNRGAHAAPRIHDLRHTFVVRRLLLWQAQGVDIDRQMLALATYVGHATMTSTYWYLTAVPELMALAADRFEPLLPGAEVNHG